MSKNNKNKSKKQKKVFKYKVPVIKIINGKQVEEVMIMSEAEINEISTKAQSGMKDFLGEELYDDIQRHKEAKEKEKNDESDTK